MNEDSCCSIGSPCQAITGVIIAPFGWQIDSRRCCSSRYRRSRLQASQQQKEMIIHQSGRKPSELTVRCCGKSVWAVGMCGSWAGLRNPEGKTTKNNFTTKKRASAYAFTFHYGTIHGPARGPARQIHGSAHGNGGPAHRAHVSWASSSMSWAGPGRADIFETLVGRAVKF